MNKLNENDNGIFLTDKQLCARMNLSLYSVRRIAEEAKAVCYFGKSRRTNWEIFENYIATTGGLPKEKLALKHYQDEIYEQQGKRKDKNGELLINGEMELSDGRYAYKKKVCGNFIEIYARTLDELRRKERRTDLFGIKFEIEEIEQTEFIKFLQDKLPDVYNLVKKDFLIMKGVIEK